jgi:hypothetical protein
VPSNFRANSRQKSEFSSSSFKIQNLKFNIYWTSALPQPQFSKSIKTHLFPTTFNQNHTRIVQNHTKTILLFNTFYQNFFLFAFSRCCLLFIQHSKFIESAHLRNTFSRLKFSLLLSSSPLTCSPALLFTCSYPPALTRLFQLLHRRGRSFLYAYPRP